jgi:hypothetical protein
VADRDYERLSLDLMVERPDPRVPIAGDTDELPTADELVHVRRPGWYERALALRRASG